ncbi:MULTISPECIES: bifunctional methylenetetrahydrofolate dehydrogenase/methenyltetrahydrofolate cyclohydrolase FolD [Clostridia]|uniref:bifunctional methylenetetrahydrofolate dehydrogenase/methenyltetrahydrofolate cyclohydrolase FolD n=1 Tax=Clostridia TaxID=186801 RepID=UPI000EA35C54|nr:MULTISPECIES: bifunctional methylenetetrahydrofolate dehydrogenase/methenyltetrahydrofolate cyclohydrolase FolD [Clostridia]NBJ70197.1 bifunctional methylenetetrahydrofolate dehydrogenase/methenyltetrahydrofolate cyclohydrolase FolD [Roseburia sp. 1XD42-34]RKI76938.1 bifunctional methylenetetrahydrofolate dehydrogenase/methenyltetrahydrofolate cyclohydrolase FolD [Clostridium sp. 1xD42-85]
MPAEIIDGKALSFKLKEKMKQEVADLKTVGIHPQLTVVLVGDHPASRSYVNGKKKACDETGIGSRIIELPKTVSESELLDHIHTLNNDPQVHGILVQLPLPDHISEQLVIETISPEKDVDGFHPVSIGRMMTGMDTFLSCTPYGIITMLRSKNIPVEGKHAVVIGRSNIVGKPVAQLLMNENATVTTCHSKTKQLHQYTQTADILVVAVGKAHAIDASYIKEGATVIDVGINRLEDGSLTGDVDFQSVKEKAAYLTPVPRGVGPMTITMLLKNTIKAAKGLENREG